MATLLDQEDKIYLGRICRYLGSIGMTEGIIEFEMEQGSLYDVTWERVTHFSNNYQADIPPGLIPILKKIVDYIEENDLIELPDVDSMNWERLEIKIDCESGEIMAAHDYGYYEVGDTEGTSWSVAEDDNEDSSAISDLFRDLEETANDRELILTYNGSGDSGFIESNFDNGDSVPSSVEDWCYSELESLHGGWEINEGSQGKFIFDLDNQTIELEHEYNIDQTAYDTVWEEKF